MSVRSLFSFLWQQPSKPWVALLLILIFSVFYLLIAWESYARFETGVDLAGYTQALYNLSHLRLPFNTFKGFVMWGDHAHFILVFITPLYALFSDARTILAIQALAVTTAGYALYQTAYNKTKHHFFSLMLLYAYLAFIGIQYALDFDFHPSVLTAAAIIWAFYGLHFKQWLVYWTAFGLGLITREDAPPIFFMIGIYLLLRRQWKIALSTMALSAVYFGIVAYFIMPMWTPGGIPLAYLDSHEEKDPVSILRGFIDYPDAILQNMVDTEQKRHTLKTLPQTFSYLPLASPFTYITSAPIIYSRFNNPNEYRWLLTNHSNANILPLLAIGALYGATNICWLIKRYKPGSEQYAYYVFGATLVIAVQVTAWADPEVPINHVLDKTYQEAGLAADARYNAFQEVHQLIPESAEVSASSGFLAHLGNRRQLLNYPDVTDQTEYVVLMSKFGNPWPLSRSETTQAISELKESEDFSLVWDKEDVFVFQRNKR